MNNERKRNIILIGFMGSGKTTVGEHLAQQLGYHFQDTDRLLEQKAEDTISRIFEVHGEEYFRDMETALLKELLPSLKHTVLSTGGGLPLREENVRLLQELGFVVYLQASKETTLSRLAGDRTRPLLQGEDMEQKVERLLGLRKPIYEKAAHAIIITDNRSVEEITQFIMKEYENTISCSQ
jgi:shikimate kinase